MKYCTLFVLVIFSFLIGGCARDACYIDKEFGQASNAAFDQQIVNKDYKYAEKSVSGMDAIYSENIMGKYVETYSQGFTKEDAVIDTFEVKPQ